MNIDFFYLTIFYKILQNAFGMLKLKKIFFYYSTNHEFYFRHYQRDKNKVRKDIVANNKVPFRKGQRIGFYEFN